MIVTAGKTNVSVYYYIVQDASATSPGEPVTGLLFSDIETGGSASYVRQGAARTDLTLITLASASATHADGGFILVDDTNMPGLYRCDYPDAAFATGVDQVLLGIVVASGKNAVAAPILVDITDVDLRDSVRGGMTALPNAAADAAGGLPISDAGGLDLDAMDTNIDDIETSTDAILVDTGTSGVLLAATATSAQLVDDVWDEVLTGATHNIATSSGRRLRQIEAAFVLHSGTAQAGASNTITLDAGANANDDFYSHARVVIAENTGVEQERLIVDYNGTTKVAKIAPPWVTVPDATSVFEIEPALVHSETGWATIKIGIAAAATSTTITLDSDADATDDFYNNELVHIDNGTGEGQVRVITDYVGSTKVATVHVAWSVTPDTTSEYIIEEAHPFTDVASSTLETDIAAVKVDTAAILDDTGTNGVLLAATATSAQLVDDVWDEVLTGATHNVATSSGRRLRALQDFAGYENGFVWIDTVNGTAGTTEFENGTVNNPVDSIADALTIRASVGLPGFHVIPGSTITLPSSVAGFEFTGASWTLVLNGQSVSGCNIKNAIVSGNDSGSNALKTQYNTCFMQTNVLGLHECTECCFAGDITLAESTATDIIWTRCHSAIAGSNTPSIDFQSAIETKNLSLRHYSGGMEFKNFGAGGGTHKATVEGRGHLLLNANCAGGDLELRGFFEVTDNAGGAVTVNDRVSFETILDDGTTTYDRTTDSLQEIKDSLTGTPDVNVTQIDGSAEAAQDLSKSALTIVSGAATATTLTTTTMSTDLTEATDDHYNGRVVIWTSGVLKDQAAVITDYTGATKVITFSTVTEAPSNTDTFVII